MNISLDLNKTELCEDNMTFADCELAILRNAVDESEKKQAQKITNTEEIKRMIQILEYKSALGYSLNTD